MNRNQKFTPSTAEESLAKQVETLTRLVAEQKRELDEVRKKYTELLEKYIRLERGFRPPTSERKDVVNEQLSLAILGLSLAPNAADPPVEEAKTPSPPPDDSPEPAPETPPARPRPTGRKPIPPSIPRVVITCLPPEVEQEGTNAFIRIGEEVSETLEHCRGSLVVIRTVRPKFIRKGDTISPASELAPQESQPGSAEPAPQTRVLIAPPPELPIPKGLAGPGLWADTLVKRWWDHLPLHRQEGLWAREGWEAARST